MLAQEQNGTSSYVGVCNMFSCISNILLSLQ